jgi:outer membrane protein TolC
VSDAELLFAEELEAGIPLGLVEAMKDAVEANLSLQAAGFDPLLAGEDVRLSRSELLPQVQIGAAWTRIDEDRANPLFQSEKSTDVGITGQQLIYSDDVWAGYRISQYLKSATDENYRAAVLDTLQASGRTYLDLLRAIARERIQRSNLELTRTNLGLARVRESIGFSGRADVLRWESQIALDRRNSIDAEASRRQAANRLNQVLHRPPAERIVFGNLHAAEVSGAHRQRTGLGHVSGIRRAARLAACARAGSGGSAHSGRSASTDSGRASLLVARIHCPGVWEREPEPQRCRVLSGGALRADLNRSRYSLRQLEDRRAAVAEDVETRIRVTMEEASSTYIAIELTAAAAAASAENLEIVTDLYSQGSVSVTDLIDAQNAALSADLSAAEAKYNYLLAVIDVLRTAGDFSLLLDPRFANEWFADIEAFFRAEGVPLAY